MKRYFFQVNNLVDFFASPFLHPFLLTHPLSSRLSLWACSTQ
jgi:hypothetical protein